MSCLSLKMSFFLEFWYRARCYYRPTTAKEGRVFMGVRQSFCPGGCRGMVYTRSRGVLQRSGCTPQMAGVLQRQGCTPEVGGVHQGHTHPLDTHTHSPHPTHQSTLPGPETSSGNRYASYWNAFLLFVCLYMLIIVAKMGHCWHLLCHYSCPCWPATSDTHSATVDTSSVASNSSSSKNL